MAEVQDAKSLEEKRAEEPEPAHVPPFHRDDYLSSPESERGLTAAEMFGREDPENIDEKKIDAVLGKPGDIVIRNSEQDGSVREIDGKGLREGVKAEAKAAAEAARAEPEEPEAEVAGEAEDLTPTPEEEAAEDEAQRVPGGEPEKPKKGKHRQRKDARYRAIEAKNAALEARIAEYEKAAAAPAPASAGVGEAPRPEDYDDDDKFLEAVQQWGAERDAARDAAHAERHRLAQQQAKQAGDKGVVAAAAADFNAIAAERFTKAQRAKANRALDAIDSKALPGHGMGQLPVTKYMLYDVRAKAEANGAFSDDAKSTGEVMADLYAEPKLVAAMEDLTGNGHILSAVGMLDDPLPVIRYLTSPEGKTTVEDLDRLSARAPAAVAARVAKLSHRSLPSGPAGPGEPANMENEDEPRAYRPGNSPRAAARTQPRPPGAPGEWNSREHPDYGDLNPELSRMFDEHARGRRHSA